MLQCSCNQGMACFTVSASLPQLRPPPSAGNQMCKEADSGQLGIIYFSLLMVARGSGGIRPCVAAFGADQVVSAEPKQKTRTWVFFYWYYFVMGVSILVASTVLIFIQDNIGWGLGLGIPTIAMLFSISIFVVGLPFWIQQEVHILDCYKSLWPHLRRERCLWFLTQICYMGMQSLMPLFLQMRSYVILTSFSKLLSLPLTT